MTVVQTEQVCTCRGGVSRTLDMGNHSWGPVQKGLDGPCMVWTPYVDRKWLKTLPSPLHWRLVIPGRLCFQSCVSVCSNGGGRVLIIHDALDLTGTRQSTSWFLTSGHNGRHVQTCSPEDPLLRGSDIWSWVLWASGGTHPTGMRPFLCTCMHSDVYLSMCIENGRYLNLLLNVPYLARVAKKSANS